jgi:hypothetical protein
MKKWTNIYLKDALARLQKDTSGFQWTIEDVFAAQYVSQVFASSCALAQIPFHSYALMKQSRWDTPNSVNYLHRKSGKDSIMRTSLFLINPTRANTTLYIVWTLVSGQYRVHLYFCCCC